METIQVVVAEDHPLMREGTRRILDQDPNLTVVGEAANGQQALELITRLQPDVAILDIRMPKLNGIEVLRQLIAHSPGTKALMLSAHDDDDYILASLEAGASGFLLKTAQARQLIDAVHRVHSGEPVLDPAIAVKVARLWAQDRTSADLPPTQQLSPREREVLQLAARGLRSSEIADRLIISVRTVDGHFNSIFNKLGVSSRIEAVICAVSQDIVALGEDDDT